MLNKISNNGQKFNANIITMIEETILSYKKDFTENMSNVGYLKKTFGVFINR